MKTEYFIVGEIATELNIEWNEVKAYAQFKYLGRIINAMRTCKEEIENRITMGKISTRTLYGLL